MGTWEYVAASEAVDFLTDEVIVQVTYFQIATTGPPAVIDERFGWDTVDHGIDIEVGKGTLGITWSTNRDTTGLVFVMGSLDRYLDQSGIARSSPQRWRSLIGARISSVHLMADTPPGQTLRRPSAVTVNIEGHKSVVVSAATYIHNVDRFVPFGDDLVVMFSEQMANQYGVVW